jgi:putative tryptophan/tyrosine transport system substrate-binding protein
MRRRQFITLLGGAAAAWPLTARAQQAAMPVVGFLRTAAAASSVHLVDAFRQGLGAAGFVEGQNVAVEYRWADDQLARVAGLASDLVRRRVSAIVTNGIAVPAVREAAGTIPIIFLTGYDPIRTGFVTSLSRPGGTMTGVVFTQTDLMTKQLGLLHELAPNTSVMAALLDPNQLETDIEAREIESAGRALGRKVLIVKAASEGELSAAFAAIAQAGAAALLVGGSPVYINRRRQLVTLTVRHALAASFANREYPEVGGLMSYGPSITDAYRRAGTYVGRVLKGEKPGDLPVELASKFELVINLATAKGMGIEIPPMLLARADEVIE